MYITNPGECENCAPIVVLTFGAAGGLLGALLGTMNRVDRWQRTNTFAP